MEMLHYDDKEDEIPIVKAVGHKNHRIVNLLLKKMADINYAAIRQINHKFEDLLAYSGILHYLEEVPFYTHMMLNK